MRHLELPREDYDCNVDIKDEDLEGFDLKEDLIELPLDVSLESDCDPFEPKKEDFGTDEDEKTINLVLKKSRRKAAQPQKSHNSEGGSSHAEESVDSSIAIDDIAVINDDEDDDVKFDIKDLFKDLKDEKELSEADKKLQNSVKEEWKQHWGIKCNMCETVFTYKLQFDKHYSTTYNATPVYTCSYCNKSMDKYSTFRSHCYRHITEGRYKCHKCGKGFSLQSVLHVHILAKHTEVKPYICEECGKGFVTKPGLKIHLKKHKNGNERENFPCGQCGKVLHTRGGLTAHMNVHRLGRRFMWDVCGKTFTQKVNMQQHVKHHNGERPYTCDKCGKSFAEKSHLARHYSFHSEKRPFKCQVCHKMYKTERCLKVHSMVHASSRPYVCTYCQKGFLSSTKLKQHYNIHTGERPFKCKYCERTFTNYPNWLKHTRRRHKVDHKTGLDLVPKQEERVEPPAQLAAPKLETTFIPEEPIIGQDVTSEFMMVDYQMPMVSGDYISTEIPAVNGTADPLLLPFLAQNAGISTQGQFDLDPTYHGVFITQRHF